jgi:autotransporter translocation and assembly factor TamB
MKLITRYLLLLLTLISSWLIYFITMTTSGLQLEVALLAMALPGKITIASVDGRLFSSFSLHHIRYQHEDENCKIDSLSLSWNPLQLLNGLIIINQLSLGNTEIQIKHQSTSTITFTPPLWIKLFKIENIIFNNVTIKNSNNSFMFNGNIAKTWNINWDIYIPTLKTLFTDSDGTLSGKGHIGGNRLTPEMTGSLDINHLIIANNNIQNLHTNILLSHLQIKGALSHPTINADLSINNTHLVIPELGIKIENIHLHAYTDNKNQLQINGDFQSGTGVAKLNGAIDFNKTELPGTLTIKGNNLRIVNLTHYKITASPDIQINFSNADILLKGTLHIPEAEITPSDFSNTITMPDEVVYVGQVKTHRTDFLSHLNLDLDIILGEKIFVQYQDLQANLGGKVKITQTPTTATIGTGELYAISGKYHAYGQTLAIQQGKLIYTGTPLLNPGLSIRAAREIKTVAVTPGASEFANNPVMQPTYLGTDVTTVGVQIQGTIQNPVISLFSTPTMNQGDILSYLLFGYPQSQAKGTNQISALLTAASTLNPSGKTPLSDITNGLQDKLGLNELGVSSTEIFSPDTGTSVATTSFIVGKQLAKDLYIHYSIGLFNPVSVLNLRYKLSKRWAIQSETSTIDSGADFLYSLERN